MSRIDELIQELRPNGVEYKPLGDLCKVFNGFAFKSVHFNTLGIGLPIIRIRDVNTGFTDTFYSGEFDDRWLVEDGDILIGMDGDFRATRWGHGRALLNQRVCRLQDFVGDIEPAFVFYLVQDELKRIQSSITGSTVKHLSSHELNRSRIPVPPLEVQREIVRVLDKFTQLEVELEAELEARRAQYDYYFNDLLSFGADEAQEFTLGDIGRVAMCKRVFKSETRDSGGVPFYKIGTFGGHPDAYISRDLFDSYREKFSFPSPGDVLISAAGTIGRTVVYDGEAAYFQDSNIVWLDHDESIVTNAYLKHWYKVIEWTTDGGTIRRLYNSNLLRARILVPPFAEQDRIAKMLDKFDALVNDINIGLPAELAARRKQYEHYRDRLLAFKELAS